MTEVVSVKFKDTGKSYYFSPAGKVVKLGDKVVVETQNTYHFCFTISAKLHEITPFLNFDVQKVQQG